MGISLHGGPTGEPGRGFVYRGFTCWRLWRRTSLFMGAPLRTWGEGVLFTGNSERFLKEGSGNGASLPMGALLGEPGGGFRYWGPWRIYKGRLWRDISFCRGPVGQPGVGSFTRDFERQRTEASGNGAFLSVGALWGKPGRGAPLLGTLKVM